ncbi:hypothetical protein ZHAS_00018530 [Anopheles sinensis]|uniref:Uncharacterized protein n=1 Tax=Anopheles sinensis TaxID=74873 RepID=A0A084WJU8_ANOSI|nr:hypothetical protein ZHAS_00018530 [Anopheles sinensis]
MPPCGRWRDGTPWSVGRLVTVNVQKLSRSEGKPVVRFLAAVPGKSAIAGEGLGVDNNRQDATKTTFRTVQWQPQHHHHPITLYCPTVQRVCELSIRIAMIMIGPGLRPSPWDSISFVGGVVLETRLEGKSLCRRHHGGHGGRFWQLRQEDSTCPTFDRPTPFGA